MNIEICTWYNNADSPVMFMIDDLANVWVDTNNNGSIDLGEDWGYWKYHENSSMRFLEEKLLKYFPNVKVTFFVPVGDRVGMVKNPKISSISKKINSDQDSIRFFKEIHNNPMYELAYHGTTHGSVGDQSEDFIQEWESFSSLEEALEVIQIGKEIFKDTVGEYPKGGKYCGYKGNNFSDQSIDKSEFLWWCRYWNRGLIESASCKISGNDKNPKSNFDVKFFGDNKVIDIPSTIDGGMFNSLVHFNKNSFKGILKGILKPWLIKRKIRKLEYLIKNRLVISIQEHMAPSRDDGEIQLPNIFTDINSLSNIFSYLADKNVWYCTGTELAEYVFLRENSVIYCNNNSFQIECDFKDFYNKEITIKINSKLYKQIVLPDKKKLNIINGVVTIPILKGKYTLEEY